MSQRTLTRAAGSWGPAATTVARRVVVPAGLIAASVLIGWWARRGTTGLEAVDLSRAYLVARAAEHARLAAAATALAAVVGVVAGIAVTRPPLRRFSPAVLAGASVGQAVPTIAALALVFTVTGIGLRTALIALWLSSLLPVLHNTVAGMRGVDPDLIDAARGAGMSSWQVLRRVEAPLAAPVIVSGVRTAAVVNVGTAALATFVGAGGLGALIEAGITNQRTRMVETGAGLTALLALGFDWALAALGAWITRGARDQSPSPDPGPPPEDGPTPESL